MWLDDKKKTSVNINTTIEVTQEEILDRIALALIGQLDGNDLHSYKRDIRILLRKDIEKVVDDNKEEIINRIVDRAVEKVTCSQNQKKILAKYLEKN